MQRNLTFRVIAGCSLALAAGAIYLDSFYLEQRFVVASGKINNLNRELAAKQNALQQFQQLIENAPLRKISNNKTPATVEHFWAEMSEKIKIRALSAGLRSPQIKVSQNTNGQARSDGLLPMPAEVAQTVYFILQAGGRYDQLVQFLQNIEDLPIAAGAAKINSQGAVVIEFTGWWVR